MTADDVRDGEYYWVIQEANSGLWSAWPVGQPRMVVAQASRSNGLLAFSGCGIEEDVIVAEIVAHVRRPSAT